MSIQQPPRPVWCGICDPRTRLILLTAEAPRDDRMVRCELCSPVDGRSSCGKHVQPPGRSCTLCAAGIPGRNECTAHPAPDGLL